MLEWLRGRRHVHAVALTPAENWSDVRLALAAGFDRVFGSRATPTHVVNSVTKLREQPDFVHDEASRLPPA